MPRGRKKKPESVEEQMQLVQAEIEELSAKLKKEMAVLEKAKKAEEQQKLLDAVAASGKSVDEIIGMLQ